MPEFLRFFKKIKIKKFYAKFDGKEGTDQNLSHGYKIKMVIYFLLHQKGLRSFQIPFYQTT